MVMETLQIRLPKELIKKLQKLVEIGHYPSKSEVIRDAIRRYITEAEMFLDINKIPVESKKIGQKPIAKQEIKSGGARHYTG